MPTIHNSHELSGGINDPMAQFCRNTAAGVNEFLQTFLASASPAAQLVRPETWEFFLTHEIFVIFRTRKLSTLIEDCRYCVSYETEIRPSDQLTKIHNSRKSVTVFPQVRHFGLLCNWSVAALVTVLLLVLPKLIPPTTPLCVLSQLSPSQVTRPLVSVELFLVS